MGTVVMTACSRKIKTFSEWRGIYLQNAFSNQAVRKQLESLISAANGLCDSCGKRDAGQTVLLSAQREPHASHQDRGVP